MQKSEEGQQILNVKDCEETLPGYITRICIIIPSCVYAFGFDTRTNPNVLQQASKQTNQLTSENAIA